MYYSSQAPSEWHIMKLPIELLLIVFNFNNKTDLNEMKKSSKHFYEVIWSKRKAIAFKREGIPFDILKNYLVNSHNLQELYFFGQIIKTSEVLGIEKLNLVNLRVLDLMKNKALTSKQFKCKRIL